MDSIKEIIYQTTIYRSSRDYTTNIVLNQPELLDEVIQIAFDLDNENHFKGCWILELISISRVELLAPFLDEFTNVMSHYKSDSSIRTISKTCLMLVKSHYSKKTSIIFSESQLNHITETCFDWLINDTKVVAKVYAAETLYLLGKDIDWIHPELKQILSDGYMNHSNAYKASARKLLKKL